jgi:hypothetical protein
MQGAGVSYNFSSTVSGGTSQSVFATYQASGRNVSASANFGVIPYTLAGESGFRFVPGWSTQVTARLRHSQSLSVHYDQGIEVAFGFNQTHLVQTLSGNYALSATRWGLDAGGSYSRGSYPQLPNIKLIGRTGATGFRFMLLKSLGAYFNMSFFMRDDIGRSPLTSYRANLSLTYSTTLR